MECSSCGKDYDDPEDVFCQNCNQTFCRDCGTVQHGLKFHETIPLREDLECPGCPHDVGRHEVVIVFFKCTKCDPPERCMLHQNPLYRQAKLFYVECLTCKLTHCEQLGRLNKRGEIKSFCCLHYLGSAHQRVHHPDFSINDFCQPCRTLLESHVVRSKSNDQIEVFQVPAERCRQCGKVVHNYQMIPVSIFVTDSLTMTGWWTQRSLPFCSEDCAFDFAEQQRQKEFEWMAR